LGVKRTCWLRCQISGWVVAERPHQK